MLQNVTEAFQRNWIECHADDGVQLNKPVRLAAGTLQHSQSVQATLHCSIFHEHPAALMLCSFCVASDHSDHRIQLYMYGKNDIPHFEGTAAL